MFKLPPHAKYLAALALLAPAQASAFCGFFVARADANLFNNSSQVVLVHDDEKTILTMVNNYRGEPRAFALVVPVPVVLDQDMVRVTEAKAVARLDAFTAPRLAEYFDPDPCAVERRAKMSMAESARGGPPAAPAKKSADALGVTVEAAFTVGEYDIVILSATESSGLETWLRQNKYNIPPGAAQALAPYIFSGMKFFVAKVNLKELSKTGFVSLRPLQFAFPDKRFMLPIRLGMLNADGPQDLIAYVITKQHRAEVANYLNPRIPSDMDVPTFIKTDFSRFYTALFTRAVEKENGRAVFTEYAWNMGWCDPCAADPLGAEELEQLGVWWLPEGQNPVMRRGGGGGAQQAFVTRLHARYTRETFPEDLILKVTKDSQNFQGRYVLRHPFTGEGRCESWGNYKNQVLQRREREAQSLAQLTGWGMEDIRARMLPLPEAFAPASPADEGWKNRIKGLFKQK